MSLRPRGLGDQEDLDEPLLGAEERQAAAAEAAEAAHSAERQGRGWLAEQLRAGGGLLRESPDVHGGAVAMLPPGYQQPKLSARGTMRSATAVARAR